MCLALVVYVCCCILCGVFVIIVGCFGLLVLICVYFIANSVGEVVCLVFCCLV